MIIELIGLPGSGKTTYVNKLKADNNKYVLPLNKHMYSKYRIVRNYKKAILVVLFLFSNYKTLINIRKSFNHIKFKSCFLKCKMEIYLISTLQIITMYKNKEEIYILDEGICQVFWGILFNCENSRDEVFRLFETLKQYTGDKIIELKTTKDIIKVRLSNRGFNGGDELKREILKNNNAIDKSENCIKEVKDLLKNNGIMTKEIHNL